MNRLLSLSVVVFALLAPFGFVPCHAETSLEAGRPTTLTIFHVNDWHGTIGPSPALWMDSANPPSLGGPAVLGSLLRRLKLETLLAGGRYLLLDAGDRFQGPIEVNVSRGRLMTDLWNALGIMVATLGNHDFDYGREPLWQGLRDSRFLALCANLRFSLGAGANASGSVSPPAPWSPSKIIAVRGIRIGLFGLITSDLPTLTYPENLAGITLEDPFAAARREAAALRRRGADLVILLSHCGHDIDCRLAAQIPGIDLIVGGHTDDHLAWPKAVGSTLIVQTRGYGSHLGALTLDLTPGPSWSVASYSYRSIPLDPRLDSPEPAIEAIVASHARSLATEIDRPLTSLSVSLPKKGGSGEADFGARLCAAIADAVDTPAAFFQAGGIRADLPAGTVTYRAVYRALPFEHVLVTGELQGRDLIELAREGSRLARHGISGTPDALMIAGKPVVPDAWYPVAFNDFLAMGGDSFPTFRRARQVKRLSETVRGAFLRHLGVQEPLSSSLSTSSH